MKLTIHRGSKEIGGSCVELKTNNTRIIIDFGLPLIDETGEQFDIKKYKDKSIEELITEKLIPNIKGLYKGNIPTIDGILISHAHLDHYGLLKYVHPNIPIYMSDGTKKLIDVSNFFAPSGSSLNNIHIIKPWQKIHIADFSITPYLVDHSAFDALAFLVDDDDKRVFYSGDFRGHGRKKIVFENILKNPPEKIDYMLLEGSTIGRTEKVFDNEIDVEKELTKTFKDIDKLTFFATSSQNIDRLISVYKACLATNKLFVIDPYTAYILDELRTISKGIPQYNSNNVRIYFVPNSYTSKLAETKKLYKFKSVKITLQELLGNKSNVVMKHNSRLHRTFKKIKQIDNTHLVYSMWEGYLKRSDNYKDFSEIIKIHTSGHAYLKDLQKFVEALKPETIIPIHTLNPDEYINSFNRTILQLEDRQEKKL